jgi:hypothetical protein
MPAFLCYASTPYFVARGRQTQICKIRPILGKKVYVTKLLENIKCQLFVESQEQLRRSPGWIPRKDD